MKQKSFRSDLHSTDCIRTRHVPDAGCTMGTGQCEGVRGQCKQCLGTGSADYTGTGEFSRGSYSGRKISRGQLLICTRIIKYALIPFYF